MVAVMLSVKAVFALMADGEDGDGRGAVYLERTD